MRRAVLTAPRTVEIVESPAPVAGVGQARVRVAAVGLCAADVHLFLGDSIITRFPHTQGHEFCGYLVELGPDTTSSAEVGQFVAVEPLLACGHCLPCRRGRTNCCANLQVIGAHVDGAMAEEIVVPATLLYPIDGIEPEVAAFVEPMSIACHALRRSGLEAGDQAVVFGAGPIGLALVIAGRELGAHMAAVDIDEARLALAWEIGAECAVAAATPTFAEDLATWTGGLGPVVAFESAGARSALESAIACVAPSGTVVAIGISTEQASLPMLDMTQRELSIIGSRNSAGEFGWARDVVTRHQPEVRRIVTHVYDFADVARALEAATSRDTPTGKVIVRMDSKSAERGHL